MILYQAVDIRQAQYILTMACTLLAELEENMCLGWQSISEQDPGSEKIKVPKPYSFLLP